MTISFFRQGYLANTSLFTGESLLQHVLDDPLLALARTGGESICCIRHCICLRVCNPIDPSFQILHAVHSMERLLDEMIRRSAVFHVVFWEGGLQDIVRRLVPDLVSSVSRYSLPHADRGYGFRGIVTFTCPGPFIQPPCRALLRNWPRNICLLGLNRPSLACLPATH